MLLKHDKQLKLLLLKAFTLDQGGSQKRHHHHQKSNAANSNGSKFDTYVTGARSVRHRSARLHA
jgi:hypothetical protein